MFKLKAITATLFLLFAIAGMCMADSSANIDVSVNIPASLELSWGMSKVDSNLTSTPGDDSWTGNQTSMAFGTLQYKLADGTNAGTWFSRFYFPIFVSAITGGRKYKILQSSSGLSMGGTKLAKAFGVTAIACWDTTANVEVACSGVKGTPGPAEATDKLLYDSGAAAAVVTLRADYAMPSYTGTGTAPFTGYEPIPLNQAAGTYSGTVTITVVTY